MITSRDLISYFRRSHALPFLCLCAILYGLVHGLMVCQTEQQGFTCMFILAATVCYDALQRALRTLSNPLHPAAMSISWLLLGGSVALLFLPALSRHNLGHDITFCLIFSAVTIHVCGLAVMKWLILPYLLLFIVIPAFPQLILYISYPLRSASTQLAGLLLHACHPDITYQQTTIIFQNIGLGITDACSGIQQLEALFLLAYFITRASRRSLLLRSIHYCCCLPAIIIANTIRIIFTMAWLACRGSGILDNTPHTILGIAQIVLAMLIFIGADRLLTHTPPATTETTA